jgi:hypothetical protein
MRILFFLIRTGIAADVLLREESAEEGQVYAASRDDEHERSFERSV